MASSHGMIADAIELEYGSIPEGVRLSGQMCPACRGGRSGEASLSVGRNGGVLLWRCHRASCGSSGSTGRSPISIPSTGVAGNKGTSPPFVRVAPLPEDVATRLQECYSLDDAAQHRGQLGYVYGREGEDGRVHFPCFDFGGERKGFVLRSLSGAVPKSLSFVEKPGLAFYKKLGSDKLIVVEDPMSAIRANEHYNSCALLGTNLNDDTARIFKDTGLEVVLLLDNDAFDKAIAYAQRYRTLLRMTVYKLPKDIKNMTPAEWDSFRSKL